MVGFNLFCEGQTVRRTTDSIHIYTGMWFITEDFIAVQHQIRGDFLFPHKDGWLVVT